MTHVKLVEEISNIIANGEFYKFPHKYIAEGILMAIHETLKKPTYDMIINGVATNLVGISESTYIWQSMLAASPLGNKKG